MATKTRTQVDDTLASAQATAEALRTYLASAGREKLRREGSWDKAYLREIERALEMARELMRQVLWLQQHPPIPDVDNGFE